MLYRIGVLNELAILLSACAESYTCPKPSWEVRLAAIHTAERNTRHACP